MVINWYEVVKILIGIVGGTFALYQFYSQTKYTRTKNLTEIWRKFYDTPEFIELFSWFDDAESHSRVETASAKDKLRFLAFLAEVHSYASLSQIDKQKAIDLFQWHYYYTFIDKSRISFWGNILGTNNPEKIDNELQKKYWVQYYNFALECSNRLSTNGDI